MRRQNEDDYLTLGDREGQLLVDDDAAAGKAGKAGARPRRPEVGLSIRVDTFDNDDEEGGDGDDRQDDA